MSTKLKSFGVLGIATAPILLTIGVLLVMEPVQSRATERPECPQDTSVVVKLFDKSGNFLRHIRSIPLSEPITDIPEFHDCQRFLDSTPRPLTEKVLFDSLYAIFAAARLDTLTSAPGGVPIATIYSYGGAYGPLGIAPGFNCLILYGAPGEWTAKMIPQPNYADSSCEAGHVNVAGAGTPLSVVEKAAPPAPGLQPFSRANYPPAARWDWNGKIQFIGIGCAAAWCEIGPVGGFASSPNYPGPPLQFDDIPGLNVTSEQRLQVTAIKGWHDFQRLDEADPTGRHKVAAARGWLFPNPELEDRLLDQPGAIASLQGVWIHVATAFVSADYKGGLRRGLNKIYMCHEAAGQLGACIDQRVVAAPLVLPVPMGQLPVNPPYSRSLSHCDPDPTDGRRRFWRIDPETGPSRFVCVKRRDHYADLQAYSHNHGGVRPWIPATARWRWLLDDAGEWTKCPTGCCTGQ